MEKSAFFNSSGGDRVYNAADFADYFSKFISNGIFYNSSDNLKVSSSSGMNIVVAPGSAWINGYVYENTDNLTLQVAIADGVYSRIDRVVLQLNISQRSINIKIIQGVVSALPIAKDAIRNADIYELVLADILIGKAVIEIRQQDITDLRLNTTLCGTVNSLISAVYE